MSSAADRATNEGCSKLLNRRLELYRIICIVSAYARIHQDVVRNTVLINRLTRVAKEQSPETEPMPNPRADSDTNHAREESTKNEKNSYAVGNIPGHENRLIATHCTLPWYVYGPRDKAVEPAAHNLHHFQEPYWQELRKSHRGCEYKKHEKTRIK